MVVKDKVVVEKIIKDHSDDSSETENTGALDEIIIEWKMDSRGYIIGKFINWSNKTKEPSEEWANEYSKGGIPDKKHNNATFGDWTFSPSDFRV